MEINKKLSVMDMEGRNCSPMLDTLAVSARRAEQHYENTSPG